MYSVDIYSLVRRACLKEGMSAGKAARHFKRYLFVESEMGMAWSHANHSRS